MTKKSLYWGSKKGVIGQKRLEKEIEKRGWKRIAGTYKDNFGHPFKQKLGDNYEIRKFDDKGEEVGAAKLWYDWEGHWVIFKAKKFRKKKGKIIKIIDNERFKYKSEDLAKGKLLDLLD
jgi:hypothetical protein